MTATAAPQRPPAAPPRSGAGVRALRILGWTFIVAGVVVLLYLVYSLFFTNLETNAVQAELREEWDALLAEAPAAGADAEPSSEQRDDAEDADLAEGADLVPDSGEIPVREAPELGAAIAMLEFNRPGSDERPVLDDPILVVEGVTREALTRGPGHYPGTALPGERGNFAVAGHRTTYGAPFFNLDQLESGDEIHATGRDGVRHVYRVLEEQIVAPTEGWVLAQDPLDRDQPMLTLTTCHPRFSARQRLIVFAELVS